MSGPRPGRAGDVPRRRRLPLVVALAVLALIGAACGVPVDRTPTPLSKTGVPFRLLSPPAPSTTTTTLPVANQVLVHVYLIGTNGRLVSCNRLIGLPLGIGLNAVLNALLAGPTAAEQAQGLQTDIPSRTKLLSTSISGTTATINLNAVFGQQLVGPAQIPAVAQLVYTATDQSGISSVAFQIDGQAVQVPVTGGAQVPVADRAQFPNLAPT